MSNLDSRSQQTAAFAKARGLAAIAAATMVTLAGCQPAPPPDFNPRELHQSEVWPSQELRSSQVPPLPTTLESPFLEEDVDGDGEVSVAHPEEDGRATTGPTTAEAGEVVVRVPLQEAIQRAVANNLQVRVQGYAPAIEETRVVEAQARFDPVFFTTAQWEHQDTIRRDVFVTFPQQVEADTYTLRSGLRQNLYSGGEIELRYQVQDIQPDASDEFFNNELVLQVTQPLLRDFGTEINQARITIARNNQRISVLEFRRTLEETISDVERTYWQLAAAEREVRILENLLDATLDTAELLFKRRRQDVTRVQISQANASVETRRAALIRARARVRDLSDELKRQMNDPEIPTSSATVVLPASEPLEEYVLFNPEEQFQTAMENRPELGQQQLRIGSAAIAQKVAGQNLLPQLNLVGNVTLQGVDEDFSTAIENQTDADELGYAIGVQFEIPIGNRAARATYRRSQLQRMQAITDYKNGVDQIALDVKVAMREVETSWHEMVQTRRAVFAEADSLQGLQEREEADEALTPNFVQLKLDAQLRLAEARRAAAQATSAYNTAISKLELAKGTLLRYNNVVMEESQLQQ